MEKKEDLRKVQKIAKSYYLRKDIQDAIFQFCKNRETIPRYLEGFGKRPDCFDYPFDIATSAKKGATSFHCSEELWKNPLDINTNMNPDQYNQIKIGWDFLIDIDSKYLDYSKIAAQLLIEALEHHGVMNYGIKFSGSKGFHIIVPFKSFPDEVNEIKTKDMFPEWPRLIASYLNELIYDNLNEKILSLSSSSDLEKKGKTIYETKCLRCGNIAELKKIGKYVCSNLKCRSVVNSMKSNRSEMICPACNSKMKRIEIEEVYFCSNCETNSKKESELFKKQITTKELIDVVDIILVASRHLFRAPYSLHEKTALASIVISKEDLKNFNPYDADPLKIKNPKNFMPEVKENQARELLLQAIDWVEKKQGYEEKKYKNDKIDIKGLEINEEMFPPIIKKILKGVKDDGRKRALYILLSFYNALEFPQDYINEKINEWNLKNKYPLKEGYVKSQIYWFSKRKPLPPNYDKQIYKAFGNLEKEEMKIKNPINYTIKLALKSKNKSSFSNKK